MAPHKAGAAKVNEVFYAGEYHPIQAGSIDGTDITAHDNGVYRALLASTTGLYDPTGDCKAVGDPYCTIFVGHLSRCTTEETLHQAMSNYGKLKNLCLVRHIVTGASRGYAFVEFENEKDYLHAYEAAHHSTIDGSQIVVDYNRQQLMPGWIPRRLGGGLGGRKESGQLRFGGRERPFRAPLREIPYEELKKLGIPLPPEGHYMSRYQIPPPPRRKSGNREDRQYKNSSDQRSYFLKEEAEHSQQSRDVEYSRERRERREQYSKVGKHMIGSSRYSPESSDPSRDDSRRSKHSRSQEEDAGRYDSHKRSYEEYSSRQNSHHKSTHRRDDNKYENHDARYGSRHRRSYEEDDDPRNDFDDKPHNESRSSRSGHDKRSKHHSKRSKHGERDS